MTPRHNMTNFCQLGLEVFVKNWIGAVRRAGGMHWGRGPGLLGAALATAAVAAPTAAASANEAFSIVNPSGTPQFAYYLDVSTGYVPGGTDWGLWAQPVSTPGAAMIAVSPGDTVYFRRTADPDTSGNMAPPESDAGVAYTVPDPVPPSATIVMPATGSAYNAGLSGAEAWELGQLNQRRAAIGSPALQASTTLDAAASEEARDEAVNRRWPDPYSWVIPQDFGWPGDWANANVVGADAPFSDPQRVLVHWDGDPSDSESPNIWKALSDPGLLYVGLADGDGAWNILATDTCPDQSDSSACGFTSDAGSTDAWAPTQIAITTPADGATYTQGQTPGATYTCTAPTGNGIAVAACTGTVAAGQPIDTGTPGTHTFTVTATDANGDTTSKSVQYTVQPPSGGGGAGGSAGGSGGSAGGTGGATGGVGGAAGGSGGSAGPSGAGGTTADGGGPGHSTPGSGAGEAVAPRISAARLAPRSFRAARGAKLTLTLSETATLRLAISRSVPGRIVRGRCRAGARTGHRCTVTAQAATLSLRGATGRHAYAIRRAGLQAGRYTLTIVAHGAGGLSSRPVTLTFTVLRPGR